MLVGLCLGFLFESGSNEKADMMESRPIVSESISILKLTEGIKTKDWCSPLKERLTRGPCRWYVSSTLVYLVDSK